MIKICHKMKVDIRRGLPCHQYIQLCHDLIAFVGFGGTHFSFINTNLTSFHFSLIDIEIILRCFFYGV